MTKAKITLRGRIGTDPAFIESKNGKKFCRISVAVNPRDNEKTSWFPVLDAARR